MATHDRQLKQGEILVIRPAFVSTILVLALAGCASSTTPAPATPASAASTPAASSSAPAQSGPTTAGSGLVTYTDQAAGFAVDLPASWKPIKVDAASIDAAVASLQATNPDIATFFQSHKDALIATGDQLYGMDLSPDALSKGTAAAVTAKVQAVPAGTTVDDFAASVLAALKTQPGVGTQIDQRHVTLANGADAVELTYQVTAQGSSGQSAVSDLTTFFLLKGTQGCALTLTIRSDFSAEYAATIGAIGQSFRLLP